MNFLSQILFAFILFFSIELPSQNWLGTVSSDWNNPSNWSGWPLNNQTLLIDPVNYTGVAAHPVITANSVFTPQQLLLQNGAQLVSSANLTVSGRIEILGAGSLLTLNAGTIQSTGGGSQGRIIIGDDASVTVNGGVLRSSQRIIAELGGLLTINSGTVNPLAEMALVDGSQLNHSKVVVNGGVVSIGSMLEFENENGNFEPAFTMNGGSLTVGSDIFWLGIAPGSGTPRFIMNGGSASVNGNIINDPTSTVNLYFKLSGSAVFNFHGTQVDLPFTTDSLLQSGNSVFNVHSTLTSNNNGVFRSTGGNFNINGNTSLTGGGTYTFNTVSIQAGKTLTQSTPSLITITGDLINNGIFNPNNRTVSFSGNNPQNISGTAPVNFSNLVIANSSMGGITVQTGVTIDSSLILNSGIVHTNSVSPITIEENANSTQGSPLSFINGPIKKKGNDAFVFPTGKNGKWRRIEISSPQNTNSEYTAEYFSGSCANPANVLAPLSAASNIEYWSLMNNNATDSVAVSLYWENAMQSGITNCSQLSISKWNTSNWIDVASTATGSCTGTGLGKITGNNPVTANSFFTFGFYSSVYPQNVILCNGQSITVGTNTYSVSGNYTDLLTDLNQQDSVVLTNVTILAPIIQTQTVSICAGQEFTIGTSIYSISGVYSDTLQASSGCDSIVNTNLSVNAPLNVQVAQSGITLSALNQAASSYQWVNCQSLLAVPGATNSSFVATQNGLYSVVVSENGCQDTSGCYQITEVGFTNMDQPEKLKIFPNPGNGIFTIQLSKQSSGNIRLTDLTGKLIQEKLFDGQIIELDYSHHKKGVYILELTEGTRKENIRLLIQ